MIRASVVIFLTTNKLFKVVKSYYRNLYQYLTCGNLWLIDKASLLKALFLREC
jgi:hypothetical protein